MSTPLQMTRGDGKPFTIIPSEDVSAASVLIFTAKKSLLLPDASATFQHTLGAGLAVVSGNIQLTTARNDTASLTTLTTLFWDVQAQWPGVDPRTVASGTLVVSPDVTQQLDTSVVIYTTGPSATQSAIDAAAAAAASAAAAAAVVGISVATEDDESGTFNIVGSLLAGEDDESLVLIATA